jgi:Tfp pilus assembly protein PilO
MALTQEQQKQVVLAVVVAVGFPYAWWRYLMSPTMAKIKTVQEENQKIEDKVAAMKRTAARLGALEKERDELMAEVSKAEKKLPRQNNVEEIIRIMTEQSQSHKIYVGSFAPQKETAKQYFVELPFGVSFSANFNSLGRFLSSLGQQERILSARNLSISYSLNEARDHTVGGSFTLMAYAFKG